jgi:hypothetical protein
MLVYRPGNDIFVFLPRTKIAIKGAFEMRLVAIKLGHAPSIAAQIKCWFETLMRSIKKPPKGGGLDGIA